MAINTKKQWYLIIKDPIRKEEFISSYPDEIIARQYMLHDIMQAYIEGNIDRILILGPDITKYTDKEYSWEIKSGWYTERVIL